MPHMLTKDQAKRFFCARHGLYGPYKFHGKEGVMDYIRQAGCIQYDPLDMCGKNAELTLQSRVEGFEKPMLDALLYEDRRLVDYYDKMMAIFPIEDWPYFSRERENYRQHSRGKAETEAVAGQVRQYLRETPCACAADLGMNERVDWYWSASSLSRVALETLYLRGELVVHHKKGANKYYALAENHIPTELLNAPDPNDTEEKLHVWWVLRRIGAIGLLWNRPSDAFLGVHNLKSPQRNAAFAALEAAGLIRACMVEGISTPLYYLAREEDALLAAMETPPADEPKRVEFLAPLDNFMWDRKLIHALFGFHYAWEVYYPKDKRNYGYYVLPVLYGTDLAARIELRADYKAGVLRVIDYWPEPGRRIPKPALKKHLRASAMFNGCKMVDLEGLK